MKQFIEIHPDVQQALSNNQGIVALESTIISHGMPYPQNLEMAQKAESIVRKHGAVPATIAIIDGVIKVGLSADELKQLATNPEVLKVSKRDFGYVLSQKKTGATTVSATMLIANMVGIWIFATGGIGGVHRDAPTTFDISRDLEELADLNVLVVCAGAKSILDLPLTLEYLETKGVEVIGYQTQELPAFYTRESGYTLDYRMDTAKEISELAHAKWSIGLKGGIVVANPIPKKHAMELSLIQNAIEEALLEANTEHIQGKAVTPFLLAKIKEVTKGASLTANLELVYNNAKLAAQIASANKQ